MSMDEKTLAEIEDERHHSPTFVLQVRVPELIEEVRRLRGLEKMLASKEHPAGVLDVYRRWVTVDLPDGKCLQIKIREGCSVPRPPVAVSARSGKTAATIDAAIAQAHRAERERCAQYVKERMERMEGAAAVVKSLYPLIVRLGDALSEEILALPDAP